MMIELFSGLSGRQFAKLVRQLRVEGADLPLKGQPWSLPFEDRVLLVSTYWRTNLTIRQIAALFGTSKSAAGRIIDDLVPKFELRPRKRYAPDTVLSHRSDRHRRRHRDPRPPHRKFKKNPPAWYETLLAEQRHAHSSRRIRVEHGIAHLKNWRSLARHHGRREHMTDIILAVAGLHSHQQTASRSTGYSI